MTTSVDTITEKQNTFFKMVFGRARGQMCIAYISSAGRDFREEFYLYPEELPKALESVKINTHDNNVYFCAQLFSQQRRVKECVDSTPNVWADLDYCNPDATLVKPSVVLQSSFSRYQALWVLDRNYDCDDVEDLARRIAYKHAEQGADKSGWDLTQLLRVPFTGNFKYGEAQEVMIVGANSNRYGLEDFGEYPEVPGYIKLTDIPDIPKIHIDVREILDEHKIIINPQVWALFQNEPAENKWSEALWRLMLLLFESGFSQDEVYEIATEAACNKYARDGRPAYQLWKDVLRAKIKVSQTDKFLEVVEEKPVELLTVAERETLANAPDTFLERYIRWASIQTDASPQYHQAGALVALSTILSHSVTLPTSYGTIVPNLWFMILADTTLTRKTTAMDIAMDLISEIDDEAVLATDGSIEGILTSLSTRPGKPSIFLRDEFSGLLESMSKKDYMSGMAELLTKLYDCKMQKRILRRETIEVKQPRLIIFAGGIKDNVMAALTIEQVNSGFIPRFVFITAESDTTKIKPVGPPTEKSMSGRDVILQELWKINEHYNRTDQIYVEDLNKEIERRKEYKATMTDNAWSRYNLVETTLLEAGQASNRPETMTPIGDRLAKSILKTAMLIAASRQFQSELVIEEIDILRAAKLGESWIKHSRYVVDGIGKSVNERQLDRIMRHILKHGEGVSRSELMRSFHLSSREASVTFDTLAQRGLIDREIVGRGEIIGATKYAYMEQEFK